MKAIGDPSFLAKKAVARLPGASVTKGCLFFEGPIFERAPELLEAYQSGELLAVVGVSVTPDEIGRWPGPIREAWGRLLALAPAIYFVDSWSLEQAAHFGLPPSKCKLGTWPEWGAGAEDEGDESTVCYSVPGAIHFALVGRPVWLMVEDRWGAPNNRMHHPLFHFASEMGIESNVVFSWGELEERRAKGALPIPVVRDRVEAKRAQALAMLTEASTPAPADPLAPLAQGAPPKHTRTLEIGAPFDEQSHYGSEYYGGEAGIRFTLPSGEKAIYQSTAHTWGGFSKVAGWLRDLGMPGPRLLDLGCGAGGFVKPALEVGFDAIGIDISEAAVAIGRQDEQLRGRLFVGDISDDKSPLAQADMMEGSRDVVTAFDLLEHIFATDLDKLLDRIHAALRPGGIGCFNICTRGDGERDAEFARGETVTIDNAWLLVAGHVTIHTWEWWAELFASHELSPRLDLCHRFQVRRAEDPTMKQIESWSARNILFVERDR